MQIDEDEGLPVRWVQWRYGARFGVVFRPDVSQQERSQVCAAWASQQPASLIPAQIGQAEMSPTPAR